MEAPPRVDSGPGPHVPPAPALAPAASQPDGAFRLRAEGLSKVFAPDPAPALALLRAGAGKDEVLARLGAAVGVDRASFAVRPGETFVVMGLSGSGKSTLVRLLNRLVEPSAGAVLLDGADLTRMSARELVAVRRREMSFVFQSFALLPHLTALENAAFGLALAGVARPRREAAARAALETVGLGAYAGHLPRELSGGMQQRVGLARALAKDPAVMFMDEAFSALDPLIRAGMQDELLRLQAERRRTVIFVTHDLDEAVRVGDRVAVMAGGRVVQVGTPAELLLEPADAYVRAFFERADPGKVLRAGDAAEGRGLAVGAGPAEAAAHLRELEGHGLAHAVLVDPAGRYRATVTRERLAEAARHGRVPDPARDGLPEVTPVAAAARLGTILREVAAAPCPVPVIDAAGTYKGAISRARLLAALHRGGTG